MVITHQVRVGTDADVFDACAQQLVATAPPLPQATSAAFDVTPAALSAGLSELAAAPASLAAGGTAALTATARDLFGNPVAGVAITFASTGSANTLTQPTGTEVLGAVGSTAITASPPGAHFAPLTASLRGSRDRNALAPLAFTLFGLLAARLSRGKRWALIVGICGTYLVYLLALSPETLVAFDGPWLGGAAWYPLIVLAIVIAALVAGSFTSVSNAEVSA